MSDLLFGLMVFIAIPFLAPLFRLCQLLLEELSFQVVERLRHRHRTNDAPPTRLALPTGPSQVLVPTVASPQRAILRKPVRQALPVWQLTRKDTSPFVMLRQMLAEPPSGVGLIQLTTLLQQWPHQERDDYDVAFAYVMEHIEAWKESFRPTLHPYDSFFLLHPHRSVEGLSNKAHPTFARRLPGLHLLALARQRPHQPHMLHIYPSDSPHLFLDQHLLSILQGLSHPHIRAVTTWRQVRKGGKASLLVVQPYVPACQLGELQWQWMAFPKPQRQLAVLCLLVQLLDGIKGLHDAQEEPVRGHGWLDADHLSLGFDGHLLIEPLTPSVLSRRDVSQAGLFSTSVPRISDDKQAIMSLFLALWEGVPYLSIPEQYRPKKPLPRTLVPLLHWLRPRDASLISIPDAQARVMEILLAHGVSDPIEALQPMMGLLHLEKLRWHYKLCYESPEVM